VELTPLRYFVAIARSGHLTRAARSLGVTQPALSAMLRKLEAEAGADLLHRTGRGVELTEAGKIFLRHAEETVRGADAGLRAVRELIGLESGSIRVGGGATATTYLLPRVVGAVRKSHPGLRFYIREAGSSAVAAAVVSGELDLGIVTLPIMGSETEDLVKVLLVEDELKLIVPEVGGKREEGLTRKARAARSNTEAAKAQSSVVGKPGGGLADPLGQFAAIASHASAKFFRWNDLTNVPIVAFEAGTAVRDMIDRAASAAGVALSVVMELRSIESIKQMVAAGIGVGFVSKFALREGEGMVCRDGKLSRGLAIVRRRDRTPSAAVAEFERVLMKTVR